MTQITDEMVEAALRGFIGGNGISDFPESRPHWWPRMRAALEAAEAVRPQPSVPSTKENDRDR